MVLDIQGDLYIMKEILLLEDDEVLSSGILMALNRENYRFTQCFTIAAAKEAITR